MTSTAPWKSRQEIPDASIKDAADQYESARRILLAGAPNRGVLLPLMNVDAMAVELYLKCLSAEVEFTAIEDDIGGHLVTSAPKRGHVLVPLFDQIPGDLRAALEREFRTRLEGLELRDALRRCDGVLAASRYPFERDADLTKYPFDLLMRCSEFFADFVATLQPHDRIQWR